MLNQQERKTVIMAIVLIVVLSVFSWWQRSGSNNTKKIATNSKNTQTQQVTPEEQAASQELIHKLIDDKTVVQDVAQDLNISQDIKLDPIPDSALKIQQDNNVDTIKTYFKTATSYVEAYEKVFSPISEVILEDNINMAQLDKCLDVNKDLISKLYNLPVPSQLLVYHKNLILMYQANFQYLIDVKKYHQGQNEKVLESTYRFYVIYHATQKQMQIEFDTISKNYKLQ